MRYRVKRNCILLYGSTNKACITLNVGQIWEREFKPSKKEMLLFPFHRLRRQNVLIEIANEAFEEYFEPQEGSEKEVEE